MLNVDAISAKIQRQLQTYIEHIGQAQIGLYRFSDIRNPEEWTGFISVINTTLSRLGQRPVHLWITSGSERILILIVNGYFRSTLNDVTEILQRLWARRSISSPFLLGSWHCDVLSVQGTILAIEQALGSLSFHYYPSYRCRSFGYSLSV